MMIYLNKLKKDKEGKIIKLNVNPCLKRRLLDLGLIPGTKIKYIFESPLKDPKAFLIRGSVIALRTEDIKDILISYNENEGDCELNGIN